MTASTSRYQTVVAEQRGRVGAHPVEEVVGEPVHAEDDAAVLDQAVGVDQLRADHADLGLRAQPTISRIQVGSSASVSSLRKTSTSPRALDAAELLTVE